MGSRNHSRKKQQAQPQKDQVAHKFAVDEKVLCYEPDEKKARVLYDSKVLEVVERTDNRGKVRVEYKIHFSGWNSSWDRYVAEDCILKVTEENCALQKELKSKAAVLNPNHLKKKKRKKTLSEILKEKTGKGTSSATGEAKNDDNESNSSGSSDSSDQESSDDEEKKTVSQIILTDRIKAILEQDYYNIMTKNMLVRIPAEVSVICVFEGYVKYLGFRELRKFVEQYTVYISTSGAQPTASTSSSVGFASSSANTKSASTINKGNPNDMWTEDIARMYKKVRQAQEVVHGLKVIFDHMLYQMLLYEVENEQYRSHKRMKPRMPDINCSLLIPKLPVPGGGAAQETGDLKKKQQKKSDQEADTGTKQNRPGPSREPQLETLSKLRRHTKAMADDSTCKERKSDRKTGDNSAIKSHGSASQLPKGYLDAPMWTKSVSKYITELQSWQMLPEECYQQEHPDPCMVYGLIHVLRFFVKLPEILNRMLIPRRKVRIIAHHVNQMIDHIQVCYVFSICRLYVCLARSVYEEDQIRVAPPVPEEKSVKIIEVEKDLSQYSTRNHRTLVLDKIKPPLAKVVEVPLSTASETLEEHQLTIRNTVSLQVIAGGSTKVEKTPAKSSGRKETASTSSNASKQPTIVQKRKEDIKKEPAHTPPIPKSSTQVKKKTPVKTPAETPPPVLPMVRQVRKSAAHAAFKTAHMFASQQSITSRTFEAWTIIKQEPEEPEQNTERESTRKRSLPNDSPVSEPKRITRMSDTRSPATSSAASSSSSPSKSTPSRKSRQEEHRSDEHLNKSTSKSPTGRRYSESPTRRSKDTKANEEDERTRNNRPRRTSSSRLSPVQKNRNVETERKHNTSDKSKTEAKKICSPRNSKSLSASKETKSGNKSHPKSISPTGNTIRLRSRSDERQLRSKGALINALSLPMNPAPRSCNTSKSEGEKSPRRRESTGNRDHGSQNPSPAKNSEASHNLRGSKRM